MVGQIQGRTAWEVASETGRLTDILLCRPSHYRWLPINAKARATLATGRVLFDHSAMTSQYDELVAALTEARTKCHFLREDPALPYQVYTRDSSQMTPWGVALMLMPRLERRAEYAPIIDFYQGVGVPIWFKATAGSLEAGDIHLIRPGLAVVGYSGDRTDYAGAQQFATALRAQGWDVRVEYFPEQFLHFDVLFCMVADGLAVACQTALEDDFIDWLTEKGIRTIDVSYKEALQLGCNLVALGDGRVLSMKESRRVNSALRAEGLTVFDPALGMISAGGGSVHCITMPLNRVGV